MASSGFSSSSSSAPAKSSQPLHNFELPPMLRWNNREGQHSGGSHRRWRSMKPAPQRPHSFSASPLRRSPPPRAPRFEEFSAPPPPRHPARAAEGHNHEEMRRQAVFEPEFERLSYMREEALRNYRGRDWWSESGHSDVIPYRRNPHRRSGFSPAPARFGPSSSSYNYPDGRRYDADRGFDVYRRNAFRKSSSFSAGEAYNRSPSPFRRPAFALDENRSPPAFHRKSGFSDPSNHPAFSLSSHSYPRNADCSKSGGFSSPKRRSLSWNSGERKLKMAEDGASSSCSYPQYQCPDFKGTGLISSSYSEAKKIAEADSSSSKLPCSLEKPVVSNSEEKSQNPKVAEADASMAMEERKKEEKSKADAAESPGPRNNNVIVSSNSADLEEKKDKAEEIKGKGKVEEENHPEKKEVDDEEEIKVWNLRPRNVKSKNKEIGKSSSAGGSKSKAQPTKPAGEKKEKKKLSIEISLTKQEIEEDIYALTGAKPSRRPKKRPKNVQKQMDSVFPGLWLLSITPESYKVSENSLKG